MNFLETENYLLSCGAETFALIQNGECRFHALPETAGRNAQGYRIRSFTPRTTGFLRCSWSVKSGARQFADESVVAEAVRSSPFFEIVLLSLDDDGDPVVVKSSDRVELKQQIGSEESITLEILAATNQTNVSWKVIAINPDAENAS